MANPAAASTYVQYNKGITNNPTFHKQPSITGTADKPDPRHTKSDHEPSCRTQTQNEQSYFVLILESIDFSCGPALDKDTDTNKEPEPKAKPAKNPTANTILWQLTSSSDVPTQVKALSSTLQQSQPESLFTKASSYFLDPSVSGKQCVDVLVEAANQKEWAVVEALLEHEFVSSLAKLDPSALQSTVQELPVVCAIVDSKSNTIQTLLQYQHPLLEDLSDYAKTGIREACQPQGQAPDIDLIKSSLSALSLTPENQENLLFINDLLLSAIKNDQPDVAFAIGEVLVLRDAVDDLHQTVEGKLLPSQQALDKIDLKASKADSKTQQWKQVSRLLKIKVDDKNIIKLHRSDCRGPTTILKGEDGFTPKSPTKNIGLLKKKLNMVAEWPYHCKKIVYASDKTEIALRFPMKKDRTGPISFLYNIEVPKEEATKLWNKHYGFPRGLPTERIKSHHRVVLTDEGKKLVGKPIMNPKYRPAIPRGFESKSDYIDWRITCLSEIGKTAYPDTTAYLQGSSVTLYNSDAYTGFDKNSEFEIALVDRDLFKACKKDEYVTMKRKNLTRHSDTLDHWDINRHGLSNLKSKLEKEAGGRTISFRVFESASSAKSFSPSEKLA